jgi:hypothetical protein
MRPKTSFFSASLARARLKLLQDHFARAAFGAVTTAMDDSPQSSRSATSYTARLDDTLKQLQDRVKEQEAVLEKVWGGNSYH